LKAALLRGRLYHLIYHLRMQAFGLLALMVQKYTKKKWRPLPPDPSPKHAEAEIIALLVQKY
jgi:hypothetical protein